MRVARFGFILLIAVFLSGCFTSQLQIHVKSDGSGTLVVRSTLSRPLTNYLQAQAKAPLEEVFFGEATLVKAAEGFGTGVRYLRRNVYDNEEGRVFIATYAFTNLNTVVVDADSPLRGISGTAAGQPQVSMSRRYRFEKDPTGLTIRTPQIENPGGTRAPHVRIESPDVLQKRDELFAANRQRLMQHGNPFALRGDESREELTRRLMRGMRFRVELSLDQAIAATNASHLEDRESGPAILLLDVKVDELLESERFLEQMARRDDTHMDLSSLADLPGVLIESNQLIRVLFQPASEGDPAD